MFNGKPKIVEIEQLDPDNQQPALRHPINKCNLNQILKSKLYCYFISNHIVL